MNADPRIALIGLALESKSLLEDLAEWPAVGAVSEDFRMAFAGVGGLSKSDADRLRLWAARWRALSPAVRRFYRDAVSLRATKPEALNGAQRALIDRALWSIVDARFEARTFEAFDRSLLGFVFVELYGRSPSIDLLPITDLACISREDR